MLGQRGPARAFVSRVLALSPVTTVVFKVTDEGDVPPRSFHDVVFEILSLS